MAIIAKRAPSVNKRGEWLSQAIVDYDKILAGIDTDDDDEIGLLEQLVIRMARMEKQMVALLSKNP
jgi:hypothetical protein